MRWTSETRSHTKPFLLNKLVFSDFCQNDGKLANNLNVDSGAQNQLAGLHPRDGCPVLCPSFHIISGCPGCVLTHGLRRPSHIARLSQLQNLSRAQL